MSQQDDDILCEKCGQVMADFLDGVGDSVFHQVIRERLESNPACQACFQTYKQTTELCKQAFSSPVPDAFGDRLASFLRKGLLSARVRVFT